MLTIITSELVRTASCCGIGIDIIDYVNNGIGYYSIIIINQDLQCMVLLCINSLTLIHFSYLERDLHGAGTLHVYTCNTISHYEHNNNCTVKCTSITSVYTSSQQEHFVHRLHSQLKCLVGMELLAARIHFLLTTKHR